MKLQVGKSSCIFLELWKLDVIIIHRKQCHGGNGYFDTTCFFAFVDLGLLTFRPSSWKKELDDILK